MDEAANTALEFWSYFWRFTFIQFPWQFPVWLVIKKMSQSMLFLLWLIWQKMLQQRCCFKMTRISRCLRTCFATLVSKIKQQVVSHSIKQVWEGHSLTFSFWHSVSNCAVFIFFALCCLQNTMKSVCLCEYSYFISLFSILQLFQASCWDHNSYIAAS